jgi:hypothetical protein
VPHAPRVLSPAFCVGRVWLEEIDHTVASEALTPITAQPGAQLSALPPPIFTQLHTLQPRLRDLGNDEPKVSQW